MEDAQTLEQTVLKYFTQLSDNQKQQFDALYDLYLDWNQKINVISRKDIHQLYGHHVLHSLCIAKAIEWKSDSHIIDLGTGGGFPGVPLAILNPSVRFTLIDGTRKKLRVIDEVCKAIDLPNVKTQHVRAEDYKGQRADFVVTRAVATVEKLIPWSRKLIAQKQRHAIPNGIFALKGGDPKRETKLLSKKDYCEITPLTDIIDETYFEDKYLMYIQL